MLTPTVVDRLKEIQMVMESMMILINVQILNGWQKPMTMVVQQIKGIPMEMGAKTPSMVVR